MLCSAALVAAHGVVAQAVASSFSHSVKPKGIAEECFRLETGASIGYAFEATGPVDFNIHFHRGRDVEYPARADQVRQADERFVAASAEEYCLMWTNRSAQPVTIRGAIRP
jgi:hypothetical protein